jgi:TRAP-type C4-dicarboxylate transport system substrate-binding protein
VRKSISTIALLAAAAVTVYGTGRAGAEEVTLRAVNAFTEGTSFAKPFEDFIAKVNAEGKGILHIDYIGGPKAMPPFEVGNAVKSGVVDMANSTSAYYTSLLPEGEALKLATRTAAEQRQNGAWAFINKLHNEKMNVWYLARTGDNVPFHLYLTKPISKPDLHGLTIRTTPVYRAFFAALGANLIQTPPGEVYTALERGVVQGYGWPIQGIFDLGWQGLTKYGVDPGFYTVEVNVLVNLDRWKKLTDKQRDLLNRNALWLEAESAKRNPEIDASERKRQAEAGIKTITFKGADREKWLKTAYDSAWAYVKKVAPQNADKLRELLTK